MLGCLPSLNWSRFSNLAWHRGLQVGFTADSPPSAEQYGNSIFVAPPGKKRMIFHEFRGKYPEIGVVNLRIPVSGYFLPGASYDTSFFKTEEKKTR